MKNEIFIAALSFFITELAQIQLKVHFQSNKKQLSIALIDQKHEAHNPIGIFHQEFAQKNELAKVQRKR